jgi:hypothetical protein
MFFCSFEQKLSEKNDKTPTLTSAIRLVGMMQVEMSGLLIYTEPRRRVLLYIEPTSVTPLAGLVT